MAERLKKIQGIKIFYKHCAGVWFTIFFSLILIAAPVVVVFLPMVKFGADSSLALKSADIVHFIFNAADHGENVNLFCNDVANQLKPLITENSLNVLTTIMNVGVYIMAGVYLLICLLTLILLIYTLILLFKGHLSGTDAPLNLSISIFIFSILFYGPLVGLNIYVMVKGGTMYDMLFTYISFGCSLICLIALAITYCAAFKRRVYIKNGPAADNYADEIDKLLNPKPIYIHEQPIIHNYGAPIPEPEPVKEVIKEVVKEPEPIAPVAAKVEEKAPVKKVIKQEEDPVEEVVVVKRKKVVKYVDDPNVDKTDIIYVKPSKNLPHNIKAIGGHAFSQNTLLENASIPEGIDILGPGAFANCVNLRNVYIPSTVKNIGYNCFFNCRRLQKIKYNGTRAQWNKIKRGSNWLTSAGTKFVLCLDGAVAVDPTK